MECISVWVKIPAIQTFFQIQNILVENCAVGRKLMPSEVMKVPANSEKLPFHQNSWKYQFVITPYSA